MCERFSVGTSVSSSTSAKDEFVSNNGLLLGVVVLAMVGSWALLGTIRQGGIFVCGGAPVQTFPLRNDISSDVVRMVVTDYRKICIQQVFSSLWWARAAVADR